MNGSLAGRRSRRGCGSGGLRDLPIAGRTYPRRACPSVTEWIPSPVALVEARRLLSSLYAEYQRTPGLDDPGVLYVRVADRLRRRSCVRGDIVI